MRFAGIVFAFFLLLSACKVATPAAPSTLNEVQTLTSIPVCFTATPFPTPTASSTPISTLTVTPSTTPTRTLAPTKTPYPIPPGVISREEMQQRIEEWVNKKIEFTDENLWLDENGAVIRLGLYNKVIDSVDFMFYNLGFVILEDRAGYPYLVNIAGFEDRTGQRFTFPFHNGELYTPNETIFYGERHGRTINRGYPLFEDKLTPLKFVKYHYGGMVGIVNLGSTYIGPADRPEYRADSFLRSSQETTQALTDFLECAECTLEDIPEALRGYINMIPLMFDAKIPYLWWYIVKYW